MEYHTVSDPFGRSVDRRSRMIDLRTAIESMRHAYSHLPDGCRWLAVTSEFLTETVSHDHAIGISANGEAVEWCTGWDEPALIDTSAEGAIEKAKARTNCTV